MRTPPLVRGRILIIDDTPPNVRILSEILGNAGYDILCATDGETGLEIARKERPDLVLLDLMLPGILGIEVLQVLKQEQPQTTVVLTTAYGSEETAIQAMRRGVNDYIINKRPFDSAEVREVVRRGISDSRLRRENARLTNELEQANRELQSYAGEMERTIHDLRHANEQLKELDDSKTSFLSMISHELRHPLTVAKGYAELVLNGAAGDLSERAAQYLTIISENLDQLAGMIDDLLDLSRMEAGQFQIQIQTVSPASIVSHTVQTFAAPAAEKHIRLTADIPANLPLVSADPTRIVQVLTNLVQNALKFTPPGGSVNVSVSAQEQVQFSVHDTGIGIPAADLDRIFEPFFQIKRYNQISGGAGLGLTICRQIIHLHSDRIWVESKEDSGSCFSFTIPRAHDN